MRALREQPRVAVAKVLGAICLVLVGIAIGSLMADDGRAETRAVQVRLTSVQQSARDQRVELQQKTELQRATAAQAKAEHASGDLRLANRRLRRELRAAERSRRRTKRRR